MEIIKTDGAIETKSDRLTLEEAQAIVGGYVEAVRFPDGACMLVNEEGRLKGLSVNNAATMIYKQYFGVSFFPIVGDAILMNPSEAKRF